jgi:hypothetical protein
MVATPPSPAISDLDPREAAESGAVDMDTFGQLLDMDDTGKDHNFSRPLVEDYIEQLSETLAEIRSCLL